MIPVACALVVGCANTETETEPDFNADQIEVVADELVARPDLSVSCVKVDGQPMFKITNVGTAESGPIVVKANTSQTDSTFETVTSLQYPTEPSLEPGGTILFDVPCTPFPGYACTASNLSATATDELVVGDNFASCLAPK